MDKYFSDAWNSLKQGNVLSPLLLNLSLGYITRKGSRKSKVNLTVFCITHQILHYTDDANICGENIISQSETTKFC
jgi:hypothetical protein